MKRVIASISGAAFVLLLFWLGGFDFNERGQAAFWAAICATYAGLCIYLVPSWHEEQR